MFKYNPYMLQDVEIYTIGKRSQFLQIHKNGCTYVQDSLRSSGEDVYIDTLQHDMILWAVIREPYERFISGLTYDLLRHRPEYFTSTTVDQIARHMQENDILSDIIYLRSEMRVSGSILHTIPQSVYLLQQPVGMYVNMKDLSEFCYTHFGYRGTERYNVLDINKTKVMRAIESVRGLQQRIYDYLTVDRYIHSMIYNSRNVWCWQYGKIF